MFIPQHKWIERTALDAAGRPMAWGHDFAPAEISQSRGRPHVALKLWGLPAAIRLRGYNRAMPVRETAGGFAFELDNPGTLTFEHRDSVLFPTGELWRPEFGLLKTTLKLDAAPAWGQWVFELDLPTGTKCAYQPALSPEEIDLRATRPDWAVGSYALFGPFGKIGHLSRPFAIDADGAWTWGSLAVAGGAATVRIDDGWLARARYPVVVDPSMGYTSVGASTSAFSPNYIIVSGIGGALGLATAINLYCSAAVARATTLGLYTNDGARVADSAGGNSPVAAAWLTQNLDSPTALTNGAFYLAGECHSVGGLTWYYDADTNTITGWGYAASTYSAGALPNPLPALTYGSVQSYRWSVYCTYTAPVFPTAANVWHDTGAYGPTGADYTPSKVGSSIPNLAAGNVKSGVAIDDVTGTYTGSGLLTHPGMAGGMNA